MTKKLNNNTISTEKDIQDNALLESTPGFDIDDNEAKYGRNHDERNSKNPNRKSGNLRKCRGSHCAFDYEPKR